MSEHRILVTEPIPETVIDFLSTLGRVDVGVKGEFNNEDHLADVLPKYDALLCMLSTPVTEKGAHKCLEVKNSGKLCSRL